MELELRPEDVVGKQFYFGKGCEACNNTGYRGRQGIYEIMMFDDELKDMIVKHASTQVLRAESRKRGMRTRIGSKCLRFGERRKRLETLAHAASPAIDGCL